METQRTIGDEVNIVSWMRGLNRHPAKVLFVVIRAVGSNPTLTANFRPTSTMAVHWFCNPVMAVRFCRGAPIYKYRYGKHLLQTCESAV